MAWPIIGQTRAIESLQAGLRSGRLHHAYLFHGPVGVGKFTTAVLFARVLLCREPRPDTQRNLDPCGSCESCRLLDQGADSSGTPPPHPDLHVVTKELARFSDDPAVRQRKLRSIPIEVVRQALIDPVYRAPHLGQRKVFIVDEAHLLNDEGQNQLLKTLEEPPAGTILILIIPSESHLFPTIRSRCQRVGFSPLTERAVADWVDRQSVALSSDHRHWLVAFADGSLGRAKTALDYGLAEWAQDLLPAIDRMAQGRYPLELGQRLTELMEAFAKRWTQEHENASKEAANHLAAELVLTMIAQHVRRRVATLAAELEVDGPDGSIAAEQRLSPWLTAIDALQQAETEISANVKLDVAADRLLSMLYRGLAPSGNRETEAG